MKYINEKCELTYFEVVEDVADERDVAHPLLQRALPHLLPILELLLESVQQVPPKHVSIALFGLGLHEVTEGGQAEGCALVESQGTQQCR